MSIALTSPVTGGAQTGFTAPTYTVVADVAPDINGRQYAVTVANGTQVGVTVHTMSSPYTITFVKPKVFKALGKPHPVTGLVTSVPRNISKVILRKGTTPLAGQPISTMLMVLSMEVPAGADTADAPNIRAALSLLVGALNQQSAGIGDFLVSGIF